MDATKDKDILIGKMLDPGATLSDRELDLILQDEELKDILEISVSMRGASVQPTAVDVEREWRLFSHKLRPKPSRWRWAMRVAAIFLGVMLVSAIAKYGIDRIMTDDTPQIVAESKPAAHAAPTETIFAAKPLPAVPTETVAVSEKKTRPQKRAFNPSVRELTDEEEMEVDEYLRLMEARIDNDLAMMQAELYVDQLQALSTPETRPSSIGLEPVGGDELRSVIMP